ncbi:hypothetical protein [Nostoc sp.]|uniref:hypothetical protein n=1 Tax=Nostoc sp. TaxID=1180 RepID=UPI002FF263AC
MAVIVTTRERPELKGFEWLPLKGLQVDEGVALLTVLGIRGDLTQFVELVDGHPLLLRLVADLLKAEYSQDQSIWAILTTPWDSTNRRLSSCSSLWKYIGR